MSYRTTILTISGVMLLIALTALPSGCGGTTQPSAPTRDTGVTTTTAQVTTTTAQVTTTTSAAVTTTNAQAATTTTAPHPLTTAKRTTSTVALKPGKEYERIPTNEKVVALTFDAAYDPSPLPAILAALDTAGANGTFFLTGEFLRDFPKSVDQIVAAGLPIGNHSYTHPDFTKLTDAQIRSQLSKAASAIVKASAQDPRPLFRPPYGARNKHVLAVLRSAGYVSIYWTIDTLDWETTRTTQEIEHAVLSGLKPGAIILMHVGSKQTASILPTLLEKIRAQGYSFVTLREALPSSVKWRATMLPGAERPRLALLTNEQPAAGAKIIPAKSKSWASLMPRKTIVEFCLPDWTVCGQTTMCSSRSASGTCRKRQ